MKLKNLISAAFMLQLACSANAQKLIIVSPDNLETNRLSVIGLSADGTQLLGNDYFCSYNGMTSSTDFVMRWEHDDANKNARFNNQYRYGTYYNVNNLGQACGETYESKKDLIGWGYDTPTYNEDGNPTMNASIYDTGSDAYIDMYYINDNATVVGSITPYEGSKRYAVIWKGMNNRITLNIPTSLLEDVKQDYEAKALWISDDDKVVIGHVKSYLENKYIPLKWEYDNGEYVCSPLAGDYVEPQLTIPDPEHTYTTPYTSFEISSVSHNGQWICGVLKDTDKKEHVARYNIANNTLVVIDTEDCDTDGRGCLITNDGAIVEHHYYWPKGGTKAIDLYKAFPQLQDLPDFDPDFYKGVGASAISADGRTIAGSWKGSIWVLSDADPNPIATGIKKMDAFTNSKASDQIYTVNGVQVKEAVAPGIYIKGGKKIVVK